MNQNLIDAYRWNRQHNSTNEPAWRDIKRARIDVSEGKTRYPHTGKVYAGVWQKREDMPRHASKSDRAYYCDEWPEGWRLVGRADEVSRSKDSCRVDHKGWFTDDMQGATIAGYVLQLPARHGKPLYISGTANSDSDGVTLYPLDSYDDALDCVQAADGYAARTAERERDYNAAWQAGSQAATYQESAKQARHEIMQICGDLKSARQAIAHGEECESIVRICEIARNRVKRLLADLYEWREARDKLRDDVPASLMSAFDEGFAQ